MDSENQCPVSDGFDATRLVDTPPKLVAQSVEARPARAKFTVG